MALNISKYVRFSLIQKYFCRNISVDLKLEDFNLDFKKLGDAEIAEVEDNIQGRKGVGDIRLVLNLKKKLDLEVETSKKNEIYKHLIAEALKLPNSTHPIVKSYQNYPFVLKPANRIKHSFPAKEFTQLAKNLQVLRTEALTALSGERAYYFLDQLADLEHSLISYIIKKLLRRNFQLISVPDIIPADVIERCGMAVRGERSQIYFLDDSVAKNFCLSGTAEMALAGMILGRTFNKSELPLRLVAVSRCYRSEVSNAAEERGIYRVHQFTKVEMFGICEPEQSEEMLAEFLAIETENFTALELDFQVLDMPLHELAAPAYRKHDIEAWYPGRQGFGEISSCSNCTDYQSRRLRARYQCGDDLRHVHTVNGTACAIPRMVMAIFETHQQPDGSIKVPKPLHELLGRTEISGRSRIPNPQYKERRGKF